MSIALDADLERRITDKVESGRYSSPDEVVSAGLELLEARDAPGETIPGERPHRLWEMIAAIGRDVPDEEWAKLPTDLASETDHYLYGTPKRNK